MHRGPVRRARGRLLTVAVAGLLVTGCAGSDEDEGTAAPTAAPTTTGAGPDTTTDPVPTPGTTEQSQDPGMTEPPDATAPPPGGDPQVLTEEDSGARVTLAVGEERPLRLGSAWSWAEPVVDGSAVTLTPVDYLVDPGYVEWLVTGSAAGTAALEVVGEPVCGDTTVCPPTTMTLEVEVTG